MIQIFLSLFSRLRFTALSAEDPTVDQNDPLSHPALKAMSARELADIPFPRPSRLRGRRVEARCGDPASQERR